MAAGAWIVDGDDLKTCSIIALAGVLAVRAVAAVITPGDVSPGTRRVILTNYAVIHAATHTKDLNRLISYFRPGYVVYYDGRVFSAAYSRQRQAQMFAESISVTSKSVVQKMTVQGKTAVATITQYMTETVADVKSGRKVKHRWQLQEQDAWVKTPVGWRIEYTRVLSEANTPT